MGLCLFIPLVRTFFSCVHRIYTGDASITSIDEENGGGGESYQMMSLARQEEIRNLRKNALLRYMSRFTLVRAHTYV